MNKSSRTTRTRYPTHECEYMNMPSEGCGISPGLLVIEKPKRKKKEESKKEKDIKGMKKKKEEEGKN